MTNDDWSGRGALWGWEEDRQLVPLWILLPCCAIAWDALVYPKNPLTGHRMPFWNDSPHL
jgi:hypothetical protein